MVSPTNPVLRCGGQIQRSDPGGQPYRPQNPGGGHTVGFKRISISPNTLKRLNSRNMKMELVPMSRVDELVGELFG